MAAAVLSVQPQQPPHILESSENWDDDFEFQLDGNGRTESRPSQPTSSRFDDARKVSIASSTALEDWDAEEGSSQNISRPQVSTSRDVLHQHTQQQTENWDDDFEDARNSPKKVASTTPRRRRQEETWDDEMDLEDETEDDSADFGFAEKEDDRTVTAKSRRAALKRLSSPPPMPPPLPNNFLMNLSQPTSHVVQPGPYQSFPQPFPPRSPNSSVFSVPTTAHANQTHDHFSSTTHLRPNSAFALLPPSPPIHKERERRRLRKKSRPKPQGIFELASLRGSSINASETRLGASSSVGPSESTRHRFSLSDDGVGPSASEPANYLADALLRTETPSDTSSADDRRAVTSVATQTPSKGNALLSRIGSVKKWGARRKRGSTTPSEVITDQQPDINRTPRVKSSRTSFHGNTSSARNSMSSPPPLPVPVSSASNNNKAPISNWFFRASSAGSPHAGAGGRSGGRTSSKGNRKEEEEDNSRTRRRSESRSRSRSRSQSGSAGRHLNGSKADLSHLPSVPSTPNKLLKRKSLGFMQLRKAAGVVLQSNDDRGAREGPSVIDSPHKPRYIGIGLGRATSRGGTDVGDGETSERECSSQGGEPQVEKSSRRTLLPERDKSDTSSHGGIPDNGNAKDGSRGFMRSVRRISLVGVGKHKRTKSGNGVLVSIGEKPPPLPSSSSSRNSIFQKAKSPSTNLPYSLSPLPVTSSELSLRLPSPSPCTSGRQGSRHGSMHDLPSIISSTTFSNSRMVSAASTQSQTSNSSSVLPLSSVSSMSSRNTTDTRIFQQTPMVHRRDTSTRSRVSDEGVRPRKSTSSQRRGLDPNFHGNDFVERLSQSIKPEGEVSPILPSKPPISSVGITPPLPEASQPAPLLPPIELQPPSPPRTVTNPSQSKSKSKEPNVLTTFDTLSTPSNLSPSTSTSSIFVTPSSSPQLKVPGSTSSPKNKLHVPQSTLHTGKPPLLQQSASLGRSATPASLSGSPKEGTNGTSGTNGGSGPPRRNSLGDLKIPTRISQAQVGLRRDLGMVREFANGIEQLKELQRTYDVLASEVQSILDAYAIRHAQEQQATPAPLSPRSTTPNIFSNLKPKTRARSNTQTEARVATATVTQVAYKELAAAFHSVNSKYRITWECADLLIELGGGANSNLDAPSPPPTSASAPIVSQFTTSGTGTPGSLRAKQGRERAITLAGDESKPPQQPPAAVCSISGASLSNHDTPSPNGSPLASPPSMSWRASAGRHDLSQRQLVLLREMLNNAHAHASVADTAEDLHPHSQIDTSIVEELSLSFPHSHPRALHVAVNKEWKWGDPRNSTLTLPSENSVVENGRKTSTERKRQSGKLGMSGLLDLLRALKRSAIAEETTSTPTVPNMPLHSTTSLSTESSMGSRKLRKLPHRQPSQNRRRSRTGPSSRKKIETVDQAHIGDRGRESNTTSPYGPPFVVAKPSPRRPSLASIFRIGTKNRPTNDTANVVPPPSSTALESGEDDRPTQSSGTGEDSSAGEDDWDRMDSASDLDAAAKGLGSLDGSSTVRGGRRRTREGSYLEHEMLGQEQVGRSVVPKKSFLASQTSIRGVEQQLGGGNSSTSMAAPPSRPAHLSNVEEQTNGVYADSTPLPFSMRSVSQTYFKPPPCVPRSGISPGSVGAKNGSVRSMPPQLASATMTPALAMTPENIKPLLENAKEVQVRLGDCIAEIRALISSVEGGLVDGVVDHVD